MDALKATGRGSAAGRALLQMLETLPLPDLKQKEALAERILQFAKASGSSGLNQTTGKENDGKDSAQPEEPQLTSIEAVQTIAPRGKHDLLFHKSFMRVRSSKQEIDVPYARINHLAIIDNIPKDTKKRVMIVLHAPRGMDVKGKGEDVLVIQVQQDAVLNIPSPSVDKQRLQGPAAVVLCQVFGAMGVSPTAFVAPSKDVFSSSGGTVAVEAVVGVNQGLLFPLETAFCFLQKPALWVAHNDVERVELARAEGGSSTFDLLLLRSGAKPLEFSNIDRSELAALHSYLKRSQLKVGGDDDDAAGSVGIGTDDSSDEEDSDFDPQGSSSEEAAASTGDPGEGQEVGSGSEAEAESSDQESQDSDISVVSEDGMHASQLHDLLTEDRHTGKKRRRT